MSYHHQSAFGPGRRVPLCREGKVRFRVAVGANRRVGRLTLGCEKLLLKLCDLQGADGQLDPTNDTLAALCHLSPSQTQADRNRARDCGFLVWERRITRERDPTSATGWRTRQTSNAYVLLIPGPNAGTDFRRRVPESCLRRRIGRTESIEAEQEAANRSRDRQLALLLGAQAPPDG